MLVTEQQYTIATLIEQQRIRSLREGKIISFYGMATALPICTMSMPKGQRRMVKGGGVSCTNTLVRAKRAIASLGEQTPFLLVYYGSDGSGGWQPLTRPLRTITTVDRVALVEPGDHGLEMRMLQVPELRRAMGFSECFALSYGTRRDRIRLLGNCVCPPVMEEVIRSLTQG